MRAEYPTGKPGDEKFFGWLETELGIAPGHSQELLSLAAAARIVPDADTWNRVGGGKQVLKLLPLPPREQVAVLEAAKVESKAIQTVIREREIANGTRVAPPPRPDYRTDAEQLAAYVADLPRVPKYIREILARYPAPVAKAS